MSRRSINHGENNGQSKLTLEAVKIIRFLISQGHTGKEIARVYGLSPGLISGIKNNTLWTATDKQLKNRWE